MPTPVLSTPIHGPYHQATMRGKSFVYRSAAGGVALAAAAVSTAPMIWNPADSGYNLEINRVVLGFVSTTNVAGHVAYGYVLNTGIATNIGAGKPIVSYTHVAPLNLKIGSALLTSMIFAPTTLLLTAAPTYLCPANISLAALAAATAAAPFSMADELGGRIIIPPGVAFFVMGNAANAIVAVVSIFGTETPITENP